MEFIKKQFSISLMFFGINFISNPTFSQDYSSENLKALLIVGSQQDGTQEAIQNIQKIAQLFEEYGIVSHEFYDADAEWEEIINIAPECSFLIYCGHGSTMGENGNAGGFVINSYVSTNEILEDLKLKDDAVVVFQSVCNGAGSSAGDDGDIGIIEAKNRVYHYAYPFFEIGASVYYANNYIGGCRSFLKDFLEGSSVKLSYENSINFATTIEFEESFNGFTGKKYSIASSKPSGTSTRITYVNGVKKVETIPSSKSYDIAYAGFAELQISDLFD